MKKLVCWYGVTSCLGDPDALRCRAQDDNVSPLVSVGIRKMQ